MRRGHGLLAVLLLVLASALVPALTPGGSPLARAHGSAFDPTTSTVTLRSRNESLRAIAPPVDDDGDAVPTYQPQPALAASAPVEVALAAHVHAAAPAALHSAPRIAPRRAALFLARAPPSLA